MLYRITRRLGIALLCTLGVLSCQEKRNELYLVECNDLYGYVDGQGDTIISCKYLMAYTDTIRRIGFVATQSGSIKCFDYRGNYLFDVFPYDNGPDEVSEGLFRILDKKGLIGFADTLGTVVITPQFKYAFPSKNGRAKVTNDGELISNSLSPDPHGVWVSDSWYWISTKSK